MGVNNLYRRANIFNPYQFYYHEDLCVNEKQDLVLVDNWRLDNVLLEVVQNGTSSVIENVCRHPNYNTQAISDLIGVNMSIIKGGNICISCVDLL